MTPQNRKQLLITWLTTQFSVSSIQLAPLSGDAGFRKYYRFEQSGRYYIAVDAPPQWSNNKGFTAIQHSWQQRGLSVPDIVFADLANGFFCLSDFGDVLLADKLTASNMAAYYQAAMALICQLAHVEHYDDYRLPAYDKTFVATELAIFSDWLLERHLRIDLSQQEQESLNQCFDHLIDNALQQPMVTVHRDFHSRNLMICDRDLLGIIDFQDAVQGPVTYDIVSLLRDCYIKWPEQDVETLAFRFQQMAEAAQLLPATDADTFKRWFDLMGVQRHCKAAGIFARLLHRDDKPGYIKDIPRTVTYIQEVAQQYPELRFLADLVDKRVLPALRTEVV